MGSRELLESNTEVTLKYGEGFQADGLLVVEMDENLLSEVKQNGYDPL